ncbi:MAG: hypothetical protein EXR24_01235 [Ignavibacteria bacterium]|nr:hypothetical protein [Bacteroidota bacterium]MSQ45593.1 hypothetical protein [Ignavibacteria bacterium]
MNLQISDETKSFINEVNIFSKNRLQKIEDLEILTELSEKDNNQNVFNDIIFISKFMTNALTIMKRIGVAGDGYDKLITEYNKGMNDVKTNIELIIKNLDSEIKERFNNNYFQITQESMSNFVILLSDLTWVKNWKLEFKK